MKLEELVSSGAAVMGVPLPAGAPEKLRAYFGLLTERNRVMNLTAIEGEEDVARLHFLDCLALAAVWDFSGKKIIDVGSGAGFPGLPIAIAVPGAQFTLLDSLGKRVDFLTEVCRETGTQAECLNARAEEAARQPERRECYDAAVSRAVARLNILCELCLPFVKMGGVFTAMKAAAAEEELAEAESAVKLLGGGRPEVRDYRIPGTDLTHRAVIIPKEFPTPEKYPRRFARIQKSPL